jgi:hypothetical protein
VRGYNRREMWVCWLEWESAESVSLYEFDSS